MPANFDSYIAGLKPVEKNYGKDWKTGNPVENTYDPDAVRRLALEVVKANFPDITQAASNRVKFVSGEPGDFYARGEYSPLAGEAKVSGKNTSRISPQVVQTADLKTGEKSATVNITTEEVLTNVLTLLHESQHARGLGGWGVPGIAGTKTRLEQLAKAGVTEDMLAQINKLATQDTFGGAFPSMKPGTEPNLEEFLATAIPLQQMEKRKMLPEKGNLRLMHDTLNSIIQAVPQIQKFIDSQERPDVGTLKEVSPPITTMIMEALFGPSKAATK